MHLTKIVVLVAHDDSLKTEELRASIDYAVGQAMEEDRKSVFYEVHNYGTQEVTLGSIDYSIEEREPLEADRVQPEPTPA
jgi:hypothetical protein